MIRPLTIRSKLLLIFIVAAALPIALVSLLSYANSLRAVRDMVGNRTERLAYSVGQDLTRKLNQRKDDDVLLENLPVQRFLEAVNQKHSPNRIQTEVELAEFSEIVFEEYGRYYREMVLADAHGNPVFRFGRRGSDRLAEVIQETEAAVSNQEELKALVARFGEIPLPVVARKIEELTAKIKAGSETVAPEAGDSGKRAREGLRIAFETLESLMKPGLDDNPDMVGPRIPSESPAAGLVNLWKTHSQKFSDTERLAAKTGVNLGEGEHLLFSQHSPSGTLEAIRLVRPVFSIRTPGKRLGALLMDIRVDYLFPETLTSESFGSKGDLAVVNTRDGEILFHTHPETIGRNIRVANPALADAIRAQTGRRYQPDSWVELVSGKEKRLASVVDLGVGTWAVVATSFPREFESEARGAGVLNLTIASVAILLALVVLVLSSRRISTSIHKVTIGAREIAAGNLGHSIRVDTHDEIQTLADAFNSMTSSLRKNISLREKAAEELEKLNRTLEDRVQNRTQELVEVNQALNQANAELKELDRLKSNFLATVSHEFRTPLTSITAFSEILIDEMQDQKTSYEVKRFLHIINTESERLGRLIKNLLDLSRIEAGRMRWDRAVFRVNEVVSASVDGLLPVFSEKQIQIIREIECPGAAINADRDRIQQVISNLLENAVKFSKRGKRIWVDCRQTTGEQNGVPGVELIVRDEGPGIPEDHLVRIFERFSQVENADTRGTGGSGLGLAISKEIIEHHQGRIWANSKAGKGASFHFTLPLVGPCPDKVPPPRKIEEKKHV